MTDERAERTAAAAGEAGADWAVLTSLEAVCYATGLEVSIEWGPSPFLGGPITGIVGRGGTTALVVGNLEEPDAEASRADRVFAYEGFSAVRQPDLDNNFGDAVRRAAKDLGLGGVVAIEERTFPMALRSAFDGIVDRFVDIRLPLDRMRSIKTPLEVALLQRNAEIAAAGQRAAVDVSVPGRTELEIFADVRCAMESIVGNRLPVTGDFISGAARTAGCEGWPGTRQVERGDPVICDLAPRISGYWGDSCNTFVVGEPSESLVTLRDVSLRALEHAAEILRPGITAGSFDADVRAVITRAGFQNPLHIGHSIGTAIHEHPRLVAEETAVLESGMVLMVEPGAYVEGVGGVRLEWMFHVTPTGNTVLCPFEHVFAAGAAG
jgi:Xaa-Pro dipeptidase